MGPHVTMAGREQIATFLRGGQLYLRYEHVRDWPGFSALLEEHNLDFGDGAEGVEIYADTT